MTNELEIKYVDVNSWMKVQKIFMLTVGVYAKHILSNVNGRIKAYWEIKETHQS